MRMFGNIYSLRVEMIKLKPTQVAPPSNPVAPQSAPAAPPSDSITSQAASVTSVSGKPIPTIDDVKTGMITALRKYYTDQSLEFQGLNDNDKLLGLSLFMNAHKHDYNLNIDMSQIIRELFTEMYEAAQKDTKSALAFEDFLNDEITPALRNISSLQAEIAQLKSASANQSSVQSDPNSAFITGTSFENYKANFNSAESEELSQEEKDQYDKIQNSFELNNGDDDVKNADNVDVIRALASKDIVYLYPETLSTTTSTTCSYSDTRS